MNNQLSILPFKFKYLQDLYDILNSQQYIGINNITMKTLPKTGYIVYLGKTPVSAGFLRRLEPCYGQLDTLCSNKYFGSKIRHEAIDLVVKSLLFDAKQLKLEGIVAFSKDIGVLNRAIGMGFHIVNDEVVIGKAL